MCPGDGRVGDGPDGEYGREDRGAKAKRPGAANTAGMAGRKMQQRKNSTRRRVYRSKIFEYFSEIFLDFFQNSFYNAYHVS